MPGRTIHETVGDVFYHSVESYLKLALSGARVNFATTLSYPDDDTRDDTRGYFPDEDMDDTVRGIFVMAMNSACRWSTARPITRSGRPTTSYAKRSKITASFGKARVQYRRQHRLGAHRQQRVGRAFDHRAGRGSLRTIRADHPAAYRLCDRKVLPTTGTPARWPATVSSRTYFLPEAQKFGLASRIDGHIKNYRGVRRVRRDYAKVTSHGCGLRPGPPHRLSTGHLLKIVIVS